MVKAIAALSLGVKLAYQYSPDVQRFRNSLGHFAKKSRGLQSSIAREQFKAAEKKAKKKSNRKKPYKLSDILGKKSEIDIGKPESPGGRPASQRLREDLRLFTHKTRTGFLYRNQDELKKHHKHFDVTYIVLSSQGIPEIRHFVFKNTPVKPISIINSNRYFGKPLKKWILPTLNIEDGDDFTFKKILYWKLSHADYLEIEKNRKLALRRDKKITTKKRKKND